MKVEDRVLSVLKEIKQGTLEDVKPYLPDLFPEQIKSAFFRLVNRKEVKVIGKRKSSTGFGNRKGMNVYTVR